MADTQREIKKIEQFRLLLSQLPKFCEDYFCGIESRTSVSTRIAYAQDLKTFFTFYVDRILPHHPPITSLTLEDINRITPGELDRYMAYVSYYWDKETGEERVNHDAAKKRKLSALSSMFNFFIKRGLVNNVAIKVIEQPKLREKAIIHLEPNESANLLDTVETGSGLSKRAKAYHERLGKRDLALVTLMLGTGIRVSECVGMDIGDVDLENARARIIRKGGAEDIIYYNEEVAEALAPYIEERIKAGATDKDPLFLSRNGTRISIRAVEKLIKKYSSLSNTLKKVTPHKLRSTYGTNLYRETQDIYLVARVLGHKDVETTRKHYAAASEDMGRLAARAVRLRK